MRLVYCDESGTGGEPFAVMAGVIVDADSMHVVHRDWRTLVESSPSLAKRKVNEFHTKDFYRGKNAWYGVSDKHRRGGMTAIADWLTNRNLSVVLVALDREKLAAANAKEGVGGARWREWDLLALHLMLAVQREHQDIPDERGHTLLIFDEGKGTNERKAKAASLIDLIAGPPVWTNTFHLGRPRQHRTRMRHIMDAPYFMDSRYAFMVQAADYVAFVVRRYLELRSGRVSEHYEGEVELVAEWAAKVASRCISPENVYPTQKRCNCSDLFVSLTPSELPDLLRRNQRREPLGSLEHHDSRSRSP